MRFFIHFFFISILPLALLMAGDTGQIEIGEKSPHHTPNMEQSIVSSGTVLSPAQQAVYATFCKRSEERLWPAIVALNQAYYLLRGTIADALMKNKSENSSSGTDCGNELADLLRETLKDAWWLQPDSAPPSDEPWMHPNIPSDFWEGLLATNATTSRVVERILKIPEDKLAEFMNEELTVIDADTKQLMEKAEELTAIQNALESLLVQQSEPVENKFSKLLERMPIVLKIVCAAFTLFCSVYSCCFKKRPSSIIESRTEVVVRQR